MLPLTKEKFDNIIALICEGDYKIVSIDDCKKFTGYCNIVCRAYSMSGINIDPRAFVLLQMVSHSFNKMGFEYDLFTASKLEVYSKEFFDNLQLLLRIEEEETKKNEESAQ